MIPKAVSLQRQKQLALPQNRLRAIFEHHKPGVIVAAREDFLGGGVQDRVEGAWVGGTWWEGECGGFWGSVREV